MNQGKRTGSTHKNLPALKSVKRGLLAPRKGLGPDLERDITQKATKKLQRRIAYSSSIRKNIDLLPKRAVDKSKPKLTPAMLRRQKQKEYSRSIKPPPLKPKRPPPPPLQAKTKKPQAVRSRLDNLLVKHDDLVRECSSIMIEYQRGDFNDVQ